MTGPSTAQRQRAPRLVMAHLRGDAELMTRLRGLLALRCAMEAREADQLIRDLEQDGLVTWARGVVMLTDLGVDWLEDRA